MIVPVAILNTSLPVLLTNVEKNALLGAAFIAFILSGTPAMSVADTPPNVYDLVLPS